jgi:signal transduction histidine kinase
VSLSQPTLRGRFVGYIIVGILLPIVLVGLLSSLFLHDYIKTKSSQEIQDQALSITLSIEESFAHFEQNFLLFQQIALDHEDLALHLERFLQKSQVFDTIYIVSKEGVLLDGFHKQVDIQSYLGFDLRGREFYKMVSKDQALITTSITKSLFDDNPTIIYAIPTNDKYLVAHLNLKSLNKSLKRFLPSKHSLYKAMILDSEGTVIFHTASMQTVLQRENYSKHPLMEHLKDIDKSKLIEYALGGSDYFGSAQKIAKTRWYLLLYAQKQQVYALLYWFWIVAVFVLLVFLLMLYLFYQKVSSNLLLPIALFEQKLSQVSQGRYDEPLQKFKYKEMIGMSQAFFQMQQAIAHREKELHQLNLELENRVQVATDEIRKQDIMIYEQIKRRSMEGLLIDIAHHWRQPLNVCAIEIQNIEDVLSDKEAVLKNIENAMNELTSLSHTITTLTHFYEHGCSEKVSFYKGVEQTVALIQPTLLASGIKVDISKAQDLLVYALASEWVDIFGTLLYNAKEVAQQRGIKELTIWVETVTKKESYEIIIKDNAGGVDEALLPDKLFEPYVTANFKSRNKGLGLYNANKIVVYSLGGDLSVQNVDDGALFTIRLPRG